MIFEGIERWPENEPLVEVRTDDHVIDLHNWGTFLGLDYRLPETLVLRFEYDESEGGLREGSSSTDIRLRFEGVADLRIHRHHMESTYEGETLSEFLYRSIRPERGSVQVTMMDGFTISFDAGSIALEVRGSPPER